jgi:hypothetical protein
MTLNSRLTKKKDIFTPITLIEPHWFYRFLNTHVTIPKKKKKKDQIKTPLTLLSFKYSCYKTKKTKKTTNQIKQHGKNDIQTKINMYKML